MSRFHGYAKTWKKRSLKQRRAGWAAPKVRKRPANWLFAYLTPSGYAGHNETGVSCGCPAMVIYDQYETWLPEITAMVRLLGGALPNPHDDLNGSNMTPTAIDLFARIQTEAERIFIEHGLREARA